MIYQVKPTAQLNIPNKIFETREQAEKAQKALTATFGGEWVIREFQDVFAMTLSK